MGVCWCLREKAGKLYLVRVEFQGWEEACIEWLGNVKAIYEIIKQYMTRKP